jgi:pyruvate ferredoxin oxidoreductase gamma subunit
MDSQAIPKYGSERSGAAVEAYIRFDTKPIRIHSPVYNAQHAIIFEEVFLGRIDIDSVDKDGIIVINGKEIPESLKGTGRKIALVDASGISTELGLIMSGYALINGTMIGAFVKGTNIVGIDSVAEAMLETWGERIAPKNIEAAKRAFEETKVIEA